MFTLKLFTLLLVTKVTVSLPYYEHLPDLYSDYQTDSSESTIIQVPCPEEDYSLLSNSDIKYLIEDKALKLGVGENLVNNYYPEAEQILENYLRDLTELQEVLEDRPGHMLHILRDIADMRYTLEPEVQEVEDLLETFYVREENYYDIAEGAAAMLKQLEKYKKICKINCEDFEIDQRFEQNTRTNVIPIYYVHRNNMSCVKLKELSEYITEELHRFGERFDYAIQIELERKNEIYDQKIRELKINLKKAAVKEFGMTMYDMLSLQDDYHHFVQYLKHNNISAELDSIEENAAEIKLKLIGLKRDLEKYKQYCMSCNSNNRRAYRDFEVLVQNFFYYEGTDSDSDSDSDGGIVHLNIVDQLLQAEMDNIKNIIQSNYISMFETLDAEFNDPDIITSYVSKLKPIQQEVEYEIQDEQYALETLRNRVPTSSLEKILALSKESKRMIQSLETAKQYIDQFNPEY